MSISHTRPLPRLRFILLAALTAVGIGTASFGAAEAQAHGTCTTNTANPWKDTAVIKSKATFTCSSWHRNLTVSVQMEVMGQDGVWVKVGDPGMDTGSGTSENAEVSIPCAQTAYYRAVGLGTTGDETTTSPHISQSPSGRSLIGCSPADLTNAAGVLALVGTRTGGING